MQTGVDSVMQSSEEPWTWTNYLEPLSLPAKSWEGRGRGKLRRKDQEQGIGIKHPPLPL